MPAVLVPAAPRTTEPDSARRDRLAAGRSGLSASVHSWELVTSVDGPGTRMTLFLAGCPLRCQYCHNPDTWRRRDGSDTALEDVVARLRRYRPIFRATGGGLTISGGEPLQQAAFVTRLARSAAELDIPVALDTSGNLGRAASDELLDDLSLVLLDVKSGIPETYRTVTGRELQPTIDFGDRLAERGVAAWIRFVLVPGLTDEPANIDAVARIARRWPNVERVEVLPFHQMGASKWERLGIPYPLAGRETPDAAMVERVRARFSAQGLPVL